MANYKEIVTKAIIGKGKKAFSKNNTIDLELVPNTVLGCWVINHYFKGDFNEDTILIEGSYDVNVWYSYDNDTKTNVMSKNITYKEEVKVNTKETNVDTNLNNDKEIIIRSLKQPNCTNIKTNDNGIEYTIDYELGIEIIGDTKVRIAVEQEDNNWEIITDEKSEEIINDQIDKEVNENYL